MPEYCFFCQFTVFSAHATSSSSYRSLSGGFDDFAGFAVGLGLVIGLVGGRVTGKVMGLVMGSVVLLTSSYVELSVVSFRFDQGVLDIGASDVKGDDQLAVMSVVV